ncbi:MAG: RNA polymerase sigma factor [Minisyncoccia bacterium]
MDITDIIKKLQKGDFEAFKHLMKFQGPKALKTAYLITGKKHIAEECVQEAFFQCYQKIYQLKNPQAFERWFYRILTRICYDYIKKNKNNISLEALKEAGQDFHSEKDDTEEIYQEKELKKFLINSLYTLDPHYRTIIILKYYQELSIKEIAKIMKLPEGTVKSRLHRGIKKLEEKLKKLHLSTCYPVGNPQLQGGIKDE